METLYLTTPFLPPKPHHLLNPTSFLQRPPNKPKSVSIPHSYPSSNLFPNSLPLHSKNPHSVYRDIQKFAKLDQLSKCLTILDYVDSKGIPVNPTTFSALLAACSRVKSLSFLKQIHAHIQINNLDSNEFIQQRLVQAYAACGSHDRARKVFDGSAGSVFAWNALMKGNVVSGRRWSSKPIDVFNEMREVGVDANEYTFSCLIKSFAGSPAFATGTKVHGMLIKKGMYDGYVMLQTGLIDMYFKCGRIKWAWKVFKEMPEKDVVVWGAMIAGLGHNNKNREALSYFRQMVVEQVEVNSVVVTSVLPVIGALGDRKLGGEIHGFFIKRFRDFDKMLFALSGLVDMYCKCGDMVSGRRVFYGTNDRNCVSWTALMSGYASNGRFEQALRAVTWMQQEGIKPDVVTIATAIPVITKLKALKQGKEIHAYALKNWFIPNSALEISLITMYSECGILDSSCNVFDGMRICKVIAWTALIDSYIKNGKLIEALDVFRKMSLVHYNPDAVALGRGLCISGNLRDMKLGKEIHAQVYKMKLETTPFLIGEIIRMYGKCGDLEKAKRVFDRVYAKGSLTCTAIIEAYGYNSRYKEAVHLFNWLESKGIIPNHFTFDAMLGICKEGGLVKEALYVYDCMVKKYNLKPTEKHYDCIIALLTQAGRVIEAQTYIYLKSAQL